MASKSKSKKTAARRAGPGTPCQTPSCKGRVPDDGHWARKFCNKCSPAKAREVHAIMTALRRERAAARKARAGGKKKAGKSKAGKRAAAPATA